MRLALSLSLYQDGSPADVNVKVGDKVLVPEYGGTKLEFDDKVYSVVLSALISGVPFSLNTGLLFVP